MSGSYFLVPAASSDLEDINAYTLERWGDRQRTQYLAQLFAAFEELAANPAMGKVRVEVREDVRSLPVAKHVVFYATRDDYSVVILRVLHSGRDAKRALPPD